MRTLHFVIIDRVNVETTAVGCPAVAEHEDKIPVNTTKAKGGVEVELHCFLTLALGGLSSVTP